MQKPSLYFSLTVKVQRYCVSVLANVLLILLLLRIVVVYLVNNDEDDCLIGR